MKYAWVDNNIIRDIVVQDPFTIFHESIAKLYNTIVPDNANPTDSWINETLIPNKRTVVEVVNNIGSMSVKLNPMQFLLLFTPNERVAIKSARKADPLIEDFLSIIEDPRLLELDIFDPSIQYIVNYLYSTDIISKTTYEQISSFKG